MADFCTPIPKYGFGRLPEMVPPPDVLDAMRKVRAWLEGVEIAEKVEAQRQRDEARRAQEAAARNRPVDWRKEFGGGVGGYTVEAGRMSGMHQWANGPQMKCGG